MKDKCCNQDCNQGRDCPVRAGTHKPADAVHQIQEPEADIWPCVNIDVDASGKITNAKLYSPGLPAGNHDVYPVRVPYIDEHTEAWLACAAELEKASPGFMKLGSMNGIECAVAAIRELAERSAPVQTAPAMAAALFAARGALQHLREGGKPTESLLSEAIAAIDSVAVTQAAPAAVAVPDAVIAGALFDFCGYLTTLPKESAITASGFHDASPMVDALKAWAEKRRLSLDEADVPGWSAALAATPAATESRKELARRLIDDVVAADAIAATACQRVAELGDRNSPEDWPEAMLVTGDELHQIVREAVFEAQDTPAEAAPMVLPEPVTWLVKCSQSVKLPNESNAEDCEWLEEADEQGMEGSFAVYTEQQVRALLATATGLPAQSVKLLAADHSGMKVDYRGLFSQVQRAIKRTDPGYAEMLRQLEGHLQELGQRWYAGDTDVVDEILQLYCIERDARKTVGAAATAAPQAQADARDAERWRAARDGVKSGDRKIYVYTTKHGFGTKLLGSAADADVDAAIAAAKGE